MNQQKLVIDKCINIFNQIIIWLLLFSSEMLLCNRSVYVEVVKQNKKNQLNSFQININESKTEQERKKEYNPKEIITEKQKTTKKN